jgi:hypothetical protein
LENNTKELAAHGLSNALERNAPKSQRDVNLLERELESTFNAHGKLQVTTNASRNAVPSKLFAKERNALWSRRHAKSQRTLLVLLHPNALGNWLNQRRMDHPRDNTVAKHSDLALAMLKERIVPSREDVHTEERVLLWAPLSTRNVLHAKLLARQEFVATRCWNALLLERRFQNANKLAPNVLFPSRRSELSTPRLLNV